MDRLNAGEDLDPSEIRIKHPDLAEDLLERLQLFDEAASRFEVDAPLGILGDYTLRRQIGRGGMGVVYEAWQNSVERSVALKVLPAGVAADNKAFVRFMREAKTAGQLQHQNIVGVHSTGVEEGTPWYSMEYVEGETLAQILAREKDAAPEEKTAFGFPRDDVAYYSTLARCFAGVADGLQHAHSKGVVHRDIKPSNLILDSDGKLRILDFGLARLEGQESLTLIGDVMGTVLYMSPEQAMAKRISLDHRTDVYSLGATMYEALTGEPPFKGKDQHETLSQIIVRDPRPPRQLNRNVPRDFETIVLKCLRKDPEDRYGTAEALAQDLRRLVRGEVIEARPQTGLERLASRVRRHRARFGLAAVFLVLVVSIVWLTYEKRQAEYETLRASYVPSVLEVVKQIYARQYSLQAVEGQLDGLFFGSSLARMTPDEVRALWRDQDVHPVEEAAEKLAGIAEGVSKPDAHYFLAKAYVLLGRANEAKRRLQKTLERHPDFLPAEIFASELARPVENAFGSEAISAKYGPASDWRRPWLEAHESVKAKDWPGAVEAYGKLIVLCDQGEEPYIGAAIEAHVDRGVAYLEIEEYERARLDFHAARTLAPGFVEATLLMGKAYYLDDRPDAAEELFRELYDRAPDAEKNEVALWIVGVHYSLKDHKKGLYWANRFGKEGPVKERLRSYFLFFDGKTLEAIEAARRAIQLNERDRVAHLLLASGLSRNLERPEGLDGLRRLLEFFHVARVAVELNPKNAFAQSLLAQATVKTDHFVATQIINTLSKTRALSWVPPFLRGLSAVEAQEGFWSNERRLGPGINGPHTASGPCVSENGLKLIFQIGPDGGEDLAMATRASKSDEFGDVKELSQVNTSALEFAPSLSRDRSRLYFTRQPPGYSLRVGADVFVADWLPDEETFGRPERVRGRVNTSAIECFPVVSSDELTLYFARGRRASPLDLNLYVATRATKDEPFDVVRALPRFDTEDLELPSSLSSDGLSLFFTRTNGVTYSRGWMATRESPDGPFGAPVPVPGSVNEGEVVGVHFVSADWPASGSSLYFTRCRSTGQWGTQGCAIYEATWRPDCNSNGSDDAEEIASGDARDVNSNGIPDECEGDIPVPLRGGDL